MEIKVFRKEDYTKQGKPKKKNNIKILTEEEFIKYVIENNLNLSKGYIDAIGFLSNGENFKCFYRGIIVGVTSLINKVEEEKTKIKKVI